MSDPSRLSIGIQHANGSQSRWGPGEAQTSDIPLGLSFSTSIPGGFKDCSFNLPRLLTREYADEALFDVVTVYGPGNQVVWQGRVQQLPREQGDRASLQVGCVGLSASLKDAPLLTEIYVDQDKSKWGSPSSERMATLLSGNYNPRGTGSVSPDDTGNNALCLSFDEGGSWVSTNKPLATVTYDAGKTPIGSLYYAWKKNASIDATGDTNWAWDAYLQDLQTGATTSVSTGNLRAAGPGTGTLTGTSALQSLAILQLYYQAAGGTTNNRTFAIDWTCLAVYGRHGLTLRDIGTATQGPGVYASDVIRDALRRCAPSLPIAQIEDSLFVIPQLVFDAATAEDVILEVNKYHLYPWGVYEDGFFWKQNNEANSTVYEARLSEGAQMSLEGDDASATYNGVIVRYTDADGKPRIVAPPDVTYADYTSSSLLSSDPNNPATLHGLTRYGQLQISSPMPNTNASGDNPAIQIGRMWLAEQSLPQRRGSITLPGMVRHPTEGLVPAWRVRSGDWIKVGDRPGDVARRIVSTSWVDDTRTMTLDVGGLPAKVEALLEAVGVQMLGVA